MAFSIRLSRAGSPVLCFAAPTPRRRGGPTDDFIETISWASAAKVPARMTSGARDPGGDRARHRRSRTERRGLGGGGWSGVACWRAVAVAQRAVERLVGGGFAGWLRWDRRGELLARGRLGWSRDRRRPARAGPRACPGAPRGPAAGPGRTSSPGMKVDRELGIVVGSDLEGGIDHHEGGDSAVRQYRPEQAPRKAVERLAISRSCRLNATNGVSSDGMLETCESSGSRPAGTGAAMTRTAKYSRGAVARVRCFQRIDMSGGRAERPRRDCGDRPSAPAGQWCMERSGLRSVMVRWLFCARIVPKSASFYLTAVW